VPFLAELEQARERLRIAERAQEADRLELDLAIERAGIPDGTLRRAFRDQLYTGPSKVRNVRLAWEGLTDQIDWLDPNEQVEFKFRAARVA
jgi:hypothetical protein